MPGKRKGKKHEKDSGNSRTFTGKIDVTRTGIGYVIVEGMEKDIMVKREKLGNALSGDTVKVQVKGYSDSPGRRMEGSVTEVLKRKQTEFGGVVEMHPHFAFLIASNQKMPMDIYIPLHLLNGAKDGDKATARIIEWTEKNKNPVGEIINILTYETQNEIAMQHILSESGFPLSFPDDVLEEVARIPDDTAPGSDTEELKKRRDMRGILTVTIDPADARDFDDAISFEMGKGGWYDIGVHIADVSHYVAMDTALDKEAYRRATSVYLPDRVLPMLPERLSNELCSLRPNEEKFTFSAIFRINKKGKVTDTWIGKTVIKSDRRYTYEEVQDIIETGAGDNAKEILTLNEMAQNLRAARFAKGAINFSSQEVRFKLDESAKPVGIMIKESKESHQLIEEFMLLANRSVAEYVGKKKYKNDPVPFPYRVHDVPVADKLKIFSVFAGKFGIRFDLTNPETIAHSFNQMQAAVNGKPEQHVLEQLGIRTMSKAIYTTDNIGHYGLGFEHYCHFTSPIRRYPDVLVHRILQQCIEDNIKPWKHLETLCRYCSDQERKAMEAERAANKYKQVEYMQDKVGEDFDAVISGVSAFGFWTETLEQKCEGMVAASHLVDFDNFVYNENEYALVGMHTGLRFTMGDKVRVKLVAANLDKRQMDFELVDVQQSQAKAKKHKGTKGKKDVDW